jgi:uncharacterized membrane protein
MISKKLVLTLVVLEWLIIAAVVAGVVLYSKREKTLSFEDRVSLSISSVKEQEYALEQCTKAISFILRQKLQSAANAIAPEAIKQEAAMFCRTNAVGLNKEIANELKISNRQGSEQLCVHLLLEFFAGLDRQAPVTSDAMSALDPVVLNTIKTTCQ